MRAQLPRGWPHLRGASAPAGASLQHTPSPAAHNKRQGGHTPEPLWALGRWAGPGGRGRPCPVLSCGALQSPGAHLPPPTVTRRKTKPGHIKLTHGVAGKHCFLISKLQNSCSLSRAGLWVLTAGTRPSELPTPKPKADGLAKVNHVGTRGEGDPCR